MLIPKDQQHVYDVVNSLQDFRKLGKVGAMGRGWFDVKIWSLNDLDYIERDGDWRNKIYKQIALQNRGVDYFSRGFFEVIDEAKAHPYLDIEKHLMLIYDRDFRFYLGENSAHYKQIIEKSLQNAKSSGLMDQLIKNYWAESFDILDTDNRTKIYLKNPAN